MNQSVQVSRGLLDGLAHLIIAVEVEYIGYKVQRILVVLYLRVEPSQVESVGEVVFVNFAEVLVSSGGDELHNVVSRCSIRSDFTEDVGHEPSTPTERGRILRWGTGSSRCWSLPQSQVKQDEGTGTLDGTRLASATVPCNQRARRTLVGGGLG